MTIVIIIVVNDKDNTRFVYVIASHRPYTCEFGVFSSLEKEMTVHFPQAQIVSNSSSYLHNIQEHFYIYIMRVKVTWNTNKAHKVKKGESKTMTIQVPPLLPQLSPLPTHQKQQPDYY